MRFETIEYSQQRPVVILTLNRPDKLNAINKKMLMELNIALGEVEKEDSIFSLVLSGNGRAIFSGFDLQADIEASLKGADEWREAIQYDCDLIMRFWHLSKPTIAAGHGYVLAGGFELALAGQYRDLASRLGPDMIVNQMIRKGIEVGFGIINDPRFRLFVMGMVAAGGVMIELMTERSVALAPMSSIEAEKLISSTKTQSIDQGISGHMIRALIIAEDARFYSHSGIDLEVLQAAMETNLSGKRLVCGGSTISQQTVKNIFLSGSRNPL